MTTTSINFGQIRVQTARMLELYGLLQRELARNNKNVLSATDRKRLHRAVAVIKTNMRQIQAYFAEQQEDASISAEAAREVDEILKAVLHWQMDMEQSD